MDTSTIGHCRRTHTHTHTVDGQLKMQAQETCGEKEFTIKMESKHECIELASKLQMELAMHNIVIHNFHICRIHTDDHPDLCSHHVDVSYVSVCVFAHDSWANELQREHIDWWMDERLPVLLMFSRWLVHSWEISFSYKLIYYGALVSLLLLFIAALMEMGNG